MLSSYVCPQTRKPLREHKSGLIREDGVIFPYAANDHFIIPTFRSPGGPVESTLPSLSMYNQGSSVETYRNFLDWLFQTFEQNESSFRSQLTDKLQLRHGDRVLITGCGLGDDIRPVADVIGSDGEVWANDLALEMVTAASAAMAPHTDGSCRFFFAVCDAVQLPFSDHFFDAAFHFGGINLFGDVAGAIAEMNRVVKPGRRVVFGDEGIGPWLRNSEYGRIAVNNNRLWAASAPIDRIPETAVDVHLSWVLGNCFYVIDFEVSETGPRMNMDVPHKGRRGGSMRTRYFGQLEGVSEESRKFVTEDAIRRGISVHEWLERIIRNQRGSS